MTCHHTANLQAKEIPVRHQTVLMRSCTFDHTKDISKFDYDEFLLSIEHKTIKTETVEKFYTIQLGNVFNKKIPKMKLTKKLTHALFVSSGRSNEEGNVLIEFQPTDRSQLTTSITIVE